MHESVTENTPELDLQTSLITIYGPGESGKSNFVRYLLSQDRYNRHVVFDPMHEYDADDYVVYRPDNLDYDPGNEELNEFLHTMVDGPRERRPRYVVVDEAANYIPGGNKPVGTAVNRLSHHNTHIYPGITFITVCRHPTDIDNTTRELYDHMFVFGARGKGAKRALRNLSEGLDDAVEGLGEYQFAHVDPQGEISIFDPVPDMGEYDRL